MKNKIKIVLISLALVFFAVAPKFSHADGIVPCGNGDASTACTLCDLIVGIHNVVKFGLDLVTVAALAGIFFAGVMYLISAGDEKMMTSAKSFLKASIIGFVVVFAGWLIVTTVIWVLGTKSDMGIGVSSWNNFTCNDKSSVGTPSQVQTPQTQTSQTGLIDYQGPGCCTVPGWASNDCTYVNSPSACTGKFWGNMQCKDVSGCPGYVAPSPDNTMGWCFYAGAATQTCQNMTKSACDNEAGAFYTTQSECTSKLPDPCPHLQDYSGCQSSTVSKGYCLHNVCQTCKKTGATCSSALNDAECCSNDCQFSLGQDTCK